MRTSSIALAAALSLACAVDSTEPRELTLQPRFSSLAPPADLPNVFRYGAEAAFGVIGPDLDVWVFAGFPDDVTQLEDCGGPGGVHFSTFYFQDAGQLKNVVHEIAKGDNVSLQVYRFSTFDPCNIPPLARGTGSLTYHDNDLFDSGTGTDSYGVHMDGTVTFTNGQVARVTAKNLWHIYPDGTIRRIYRRVTITPN